MGWIRRTLFKFCVTVAVVVLLWMLMLVWTKNGHLPTRELAGAKIRPGFKTVRPSAVLPDRQNDWLKKTLDELPLGMVSRDVTWQEEWPDVEGPRLSPDHVVPPIVHYLWSGRDRLFTFQHYLGVLSALRITKPLKVVFHYTDNLPVIDTFRYNSWFSELNKTVPFLDLRKLPVTTNYTAVDVLISTLDLVAKEGGVFLGERVVLARPPPKLGKNRTSWLASSHEAAPGLGPALLFLKDSHSHSGFNVSAMLLSYGDTTCVTVDTFNKVGPGPGRECVLLNPDASQYPRDIWGSSTPYAELARWLFYGRRTRLQVKPDQRQPIPRITHYVRLLSTAYPMYTEELSFSHFIGILSALYVAGFHHVYLHVKQEMTGRWWEELRGENITVVMLQESHTVFQQKVTWIKHISDLSRYNVVYKYGGAYQDFDVVWTSYVPDKLLAYPTVISPDISSNGLWPGGLSVGLFLARPRAPFLHHFLKTYREFRAGMPLYNSITMSYRTMELYPDTVLVEPRVQVICFRNFCHPLWQRPQLWDLRLDGGNGYNWTECHAVHIPAPKPVASFQSLAALRNGSDMFAHIGRWVLDRSGRSRLLEQP